MNTDTIEHARSMGTKEAALIQQWTEMLLNQSGLNFKSYSATWLEDAKSGVKDYGLAASQEIGEWHESFGQYRWWGMTDPDIANCRTELVDCLHFAMSHDLAQLGDTEYQARITATKYARAVMKFHSKDLQDESKSEITKIAKELQMSLLKGGMDGFNFPHFYYLCVYGADMPMELLYLRYMGKSTLNKFRQVNGYSTKPRTYKKMWGEHEDNFHLARYLDDNYRSTELELTPESIYTWIESQYQFYSKVTALA